MLYTYLFRRRLVHLYIVLAQLRKSILFPLYLIPLKFLFFPGKCGNLRIKGGRKVRKMGLYIIFRIKMLFLPMD